MKTDIQEATINGVVYVRKDSIPQNKPAVSVDGLPYVVIRSAQSGCHAGYIKAITGDTITLVRARRLWYWDGAATLSQLAMEGVKSPSNCKFPCEVDEITVFNCCEKIVATESAMKSIQGVSVWKK